MVRAYGTTENAIFDLASVTKVCPTSTLALKRILEGELDLEMKVANFIPELQTNYRNEIRLWHLLTHSLDYRVRMSSLKDLPPKQILEFLYSYPFDKKPGTIFNYGNPASILLGILLMRLTGKKLSQLAEDEFFKPLGMSRSGWNPLEKFSKEEKIVIKNTFFTYNMIIFIISVFIFTINSESFSKCLRNIIPITFFNFN